MAPFNPAGASPQTVGKTTFDKGTSATPAVWEKLPSAGIVASPTQPTTTVEGSGWLDTTKGSLYVYYSGAWAEVGGGASSSIKAVETAPASPKDGDGWLQPSTGKLYIYFNSGWAEVGGGSKGPEQVVAEKAPTASDTKPDGTIWYAWGA